MHFSLRGFYFRYKIHSNKEKRNDFKTLHCVNQSGVNELEYHISKELSQNVKMHIFIGGYLRVDKLQVKDNLLGVL